MSHSPLMPFSWGQTECPSKSLTMAARTRSHRIIIWRRDRGQVMGTYLLPPASSSRDSLRGILPQPWPETGQQSHETLKSITTQIKGTGFTISSTFRTDLPAFGACCCSSCISAVSKTKLSPSACCSLSPVLYHGPFETLVFSKGKENILCYLEFSMVTVCPEVTCPSKETFSII